MAEPGLCSAATVVPYATLVVSPRPLAHAHTYTFARQRQSKPHGPCPQLHDRWRADQISHSCDDWHLSHRPIVLAVHQECVFLPKAHFGHPSGLLGASFFLNFAWNRTVHYKFLVPQLFLKGLFSYPYSFENIWWYFVVLIKSKIQVKI